MGHALNAIKSKSKIAEHQVQVGEVADAVYDQHTLNNPPSLQALKLQDLLMKTAGPAICEDRWHEVELAAVKRLKGMRNASHQEIVGLFQQLRASTLTYENLKEGYTGIYGLVSVGRVEFEEFGKLRFRFDEEFRKVVATSNLYAILDRQTSLALTSRYAHRLHEMIALRSGRTRTSERFTVDNLRARLGVANGRLKTWDEFRRRALEPAIEEVNQLSRFSVSWRVTQKVQRRVSEIELAWEVLRDLAPVQKELDRAKVGRKARRDDTDEEILDEPPAPPLPLAFPEDGGVKFKDPWASIREAMGIDKADGDRLAASFRAHLKDQGLALDHPSIRELFTAFCQLAKLEYAAR